VFLFQLYPDICLKKPKLVWIIFSPYLKGNICHNYKDQLIKAV
jgi:hypothetical protein